MVLCQHCPRPANTKKTERDEYGRVRDRYLCDECEIAEVIGEFVRPRRR